MIALNLRCPLHPRYKAIHAPRVKNCTGCNCVGIWAIAQWARGREYHWQFASVYKSLVHSVNPA
jgi:hypothetical protein